MLEYTYLANPNSDFLRKINYFPKILSYLKVVDKFPADYTFYRVWGPTQWNPQALHQASQQPSPKTSVSLESFIRKFYKSKWASRTWYAYKRVSKLSQSINHTQLFIPNRNTNAGPVTVWLQVCYMHLYCAHVAAMKGGGKQSKQYV